MVETTGDHLLFLPQAKSSGQATTAVFIAGIQPFCFARLQERHDEVQHEGENESQQGGIKGRGKTRGDAGQ